MIHAICEKGDVINTSFLEKSCPIETQRKLSDYIMDVMKINRDDCSIGETEHPFTTEFNKHDVRITTHYYENMVASSMYSVIHEGGHAIYELNTGDDLIGTTMAGGASMGIHESQSRFYENIIGKSEGFWQYIYEPLVEILPQLKAYTPRDLFASVNYAQPSLLRLEADELTYLLHIIIRYELEKDIISGSLNIDTLAEAWSEKYEAYLGIRPQNDAEGVLQDIHWAAGYVGYFPSYFIANITAAQLAAAMNEQIGDMHTLMADGAFDEIHAWLSQRIYRYGSLYSSRELIENACGRPLSSDDYMDYLRNKFSEVYRLH